MGVPVVHGSVTVVDVGCRPASSHARSASARSPMIVVDPTTHRSTTASSAALGGGSASARPLADCVSTWAANLSRSLRTTSVNTASGGAPSNESAVLFPRYTVRQYTTSSNPEEVRPVSLFQSELDRNDRDPRSDRAEPTGCRCYTASGGSPAAHRILAPGSSGGFVGGFEHCRLPSLVRADEDRLADLDVEPAGISERCGSSALGH